MTDWRTLGTVAVIALITALLRFLPFWIFRNSERIPRIVKKLSKLLPFAVMGMLVVYCVRGLHFASLSGFLPTLIACAVVGVLYVWRRNTLLSILCGTLCYMLLVQLVF
ncbi:MAG: branched-chain amino acid transporter AzlD [Ruminococcaceae bacterium]|nr:branched-chain amino acid transporter AzlD [Oscillospiraceae bacterium]